ncbi:uncharacterized protein TRAVEDRAFT_28753 [Trametes versicolor FP-101664 SS1]|uniref:uncharacterized protein n=1 Tax=Trametes versicolor (strain FP-101664) TaxID=717944 RepID=UPI0004621C91|nr:uncharacterized protein TRAVEDRAFT_28753 [Trametes versicolor FP-101664 SS1]EIW59725.1 hypothetical protein TRAVEDRAFT_28753 [Trametes versicolor FP-101664 SS1]
MQLDFLSNSPLNSAVVDAATGETLYTISTPRTLGTRATTVCDAAGKTVALYRRHWGRGEVELHGVTRDVSSWLVSDGVFSSSKRFVAPDGRTYVWKKQWGTSEFELVDDQTQQLVAKSSGARSVLRPSDRMSLEISPQAVPILDAVVLSFIICEKNRRGKNAATAATVAVV